LQILIQGGDLAVDRVTSFNCGGKGDIVQGATAPIVLGAVIDVYMLGVEELCRAKGTGCG
jgi:hypothetical protein